MQADGVGFAAEGPTKRTRRPSVRLHEPYYEYPLAAHRKPVQRQSDGPKKPPISKAAQAKNTKKGGDDQGEDIEFDDNDDVAIGKWKSFNVSNRNRDFKRKRASPSVSKKSSSGNGKQEEEEEEDDDIDSKLVVEDTNQTSPSPSNPLLGSDDGDDKLSYGNNKNGNVDRNLQRGLRNGNGDGVRAWLKELGLEKYALLFEVHEVDDEVLGQLTLEDLKDMGINAVGSRRKMYASIQKLGKRVDC